MKEHSKPSWGQARRQSSLLWLVTVILLSASQLTWAASRGAVDQANEVFTSRASRNVGAMAPMGQEFKPQQRKLNMVELYLGDASCTKDAGAGAEVQVRIRRSTVEGAVLAESPAVAFPNCFDGIIRNDRGSTYPRGRQVIQGVPHEDKDLWFREGTVSPEDKWWKSS